MTSATHPGPSTILHVDMDAFYASIEQRDNPSLRGRPVIVGAPPDRRGVVSAASYEARVFGVHSAMPSRTAGKLCPNGVFVPVDMGRYMDVSGQVMEILESFTPVVEQLSVDEAFLDVAGVMRKWREPVRIARAIKEKIREDLDLAASVGVATNKFLAKMASDLEKPDGLTVVPATSEEIVAFLAPWPVSKIWGVGKKGEQMLHSHGIMLIGDIQARTPDQLKHVLGVAMGEHVWDLAHGLDDREVDTQWQEKSISSEHTFAQDSSSLETVRATLLRQVERVGSRMRRAGKKGRTGHVKLRFENFETITRQRSLGGSTDSDRALIQCALDLLEKEHVQRPIRLVGFGVSDIVDASITTSERQAMLFEEMDDSKRHRRDARLDRAVDEVREAYGSDALLRGVPGRGKGAGRA